MRKFEYVRRVEDKSFKLPERSTTNSAGYDFYNPERVEIMSKEIVYVKTGVKAYMPKEEMLVLCNRSSNAKKKGLVLVNGIGICDSDYVDNEDNEGEIAFAFMNITDKVIVIEAEEKLGQGIFMEYKITDDDTAEVERTGGFGSTGK